MKAAAQALILLLFLFLIFLGIRVKEPARIFINASAVCYSCIGIE